MVKVTEMDQMIKEMAVLEQQKAQLDEKMKKVAKEIEEKKQESRRNAIKNDPLLGDQPMVLVEEDITNTNPLGRVWNVVQHPTLGPPFLDWDTVVDSNATTGFAQAPRVAPGEDNVQLPVSAAERQYFTFPETTNQAGTATQLRTMEGAQEDDVASYIIPDGVSHGWCTATSAKDGLIFGYVWPTEDYPWLSLYRSVVDGKVAA